MTLPYFEERLEPAREAVALSRRVLQALGGVALCVATALFSFWTHFNLSTAASLQLLLIVLISFRWSFREATIASVVAGLCLNFLFTEPLFRLSVAEPANLVSLLAFEVSALLVSALSSKVKQNAAKADLERSRMARLYEISKAILLIDGHQSTQEQLAAFIRELAPVKDVGFWVLYPSEQDAANVCEEEPSSEGHRLARAVYRGNKDYDDAKQRLSARVLRIGTTAIGAMVLRGWEADPMMADAIASLAALAFERSRAVEKESQAEAGRRAEQLRTAVLDGLAHAIKTPLTAIITANSGMLALGGLSETQEELGTLVDKEALALNRLATQLLRTAALESRDVRMKKAQLDIVEIVEDILVNEGAAYSERVSISAEESTAVYADAQMLRTALCQLMDNAAKYSAVGTRIELAVVRGDEEMKVMVANRGSTVRKDEREKIFERYFRGSDTAFGPAGTGLGLSIVKKTAEAHGGRAWVECVDDVTTFVMTIEDVARVSK